MAPTTHTSLPTYTARQLLALQPGARLRVATGGRELEVELQGNPWRTAPAVALRNTRARQVSMVVKAGPKARVSRIVTGEQVLEVL